MVVTVSRFFCLGLPAAGVTLGILFFIGNLLIVTYSIKDLIELDEQEKDDFEMFSDRDSEKIGVITSQIFSNLLFAFASLLLIIGTKKKLHLVLLPWLILHALVILLGVGACLYLFSLAARNWPNDLGRSAIFLIGSITASTIAIYLWIVIFSLFSMIQNENQSPMEEPLVNSYI